MNSSCPFCGFPPIAYTDEGLTALAAEEDYELASMVVDGPPFGGYILPYSAAAGT